MKYAIPAAAAVALAGLAFSQPALAARSADALPSPSAKVSTAIGRTSAPIGQAEQLKSGYVLGLFAFVAIIAAIAIAASGGNDSPG